MTIQRSKPCNIQILFMESEFDVTLRAVESILYQMEDGDTLSILLNGGPRPDFAEKFSALYGVKYYEALENLGVAGGRNFLLKNEECLSSEYVFFVDNDAIIPCDYLKNMKNFLDSDPNIGIAGVVVLKYKAFEKPLDEIGQPFTGYLGESIWSVHSADVRHYLTGKTYAKYFDHLGTDKNWQDAYFNDLNTIDTIKVNLGITQKREYFSFNAASKEIRNLVCNSTQGRLEISNIAGCCQSFKVSLLKEIGPLNNLFNMYGYEDTDFALRAIKHGYKNYIDLNNFMFHGTDNRHSQRQTSHGIRKKLRNQIRAYTILDFIWEKDRFPYVSIQRIINRGLMRETMETHKVIEDIATYISGFKWGCSQIHAEYGQDFIDIVEKCSKEYNLDIDPYTLINNLSNLSVNSNDSNLQTYAHQLHNIKKLEEKQNYSNSLIKSQVLEILGKDTTVKKVEKPKDDTIPSFTQLKAFKNRHKGQRCFIIGNGPSLNKTDLSLLKDEITFGVNSFHYMTDSNGFKPTYYTVEDNLVVADNIDRINSYNTKAKFFPEKYKGIINHDENVYFLPVDWSYYFKSSPFFETPQFSTEISDTIYVGQTVTYMNLQLAFYMGFKEVYLIGVDFSYEIPKADPVEGFSITSSGDDPNHFHPDYFGKGKKWHFPKLHNCLKAYLHSRKVYEAHDRKVYNATIGGRLEAYERVDFYSLFDDCTKLKEPNSVNTWYFNLISSKMLRYAKEQNKSLVGLVHSNSKKILTTDFQAITNKYSPSTKSNENSLTIAAVDISTLDISLLKLPDVALIYGLNFTRHPSTLVNNLKYIELLKSYGLDNISVYNHNEISIIVSKSLNFNLFADFNIETNWKLRGIRNTCLSEAIKALHTKRRINKSYRIPIIQPNHGFPAESDMHNIMIQEYIDLLNLFTENSVPYVIEKAHFCYTF